jgi:hydroxymethylpyrimidine kinase/phosphomethylpyrimidine kinase
VTPPVVLTIGSSDSGGGGGIQGDLRTLAALKVYGASVVTAVFAQNSRTTTDIYTLPGTVVALQLSTVLEDMAPAAAKTGAFASAEACAAVTAKARAGALPNLVVDPVFDTARGGRKGVIAALERLLPHALVATPNREEASTLLGWQVATPADMAGAAAQLASNGPKYVVVTGGDFVAGQDAIDVMWVEGSARTLHAPRIKRRAYGSGGSFAAAIAGRLALGDSPSDAVTYAKSFVTKAISDAAEWKIGTGAAAMDHFGWSALSLS